jgi:hypothetical protein
VLVKCFMKSSPYSETIKQTTSYYIVGDTVQPDLETTPSPTIEISKSAAKHVLAWQLWVRCHR